MKSSTGFRIITLCMKLGSQNIFVTICVHVCYNIVNYHVINVLIGFALFSKNCRDDTTGNNCELCPRGFYGDATKGTPEDCKQCPCPLPGSSNR